MWFQFGNALNIIITIKPIEYTYDYYDGYDQPTRLRQRLQEDDWEDDWDEENDLDTIDEESDETQTTDDGTDVIDRDSYVDPIFVPDENSKFTVGF